MDSLLHQVVSLKFTIAHFTYSQLILSVLNFHGVDILQDFLQTLQEELLLQLYDWAYCKCLRFISIRLCLVTASAQVVIVWFSLGRRGCALQRGSGGFRGGGIVVVLSSVLVFFILFFIVVVAVHRVVDIVIVTALFWQSSSVSIFFYFRIFKRGIYISAYCRSGLASPLLLFFTVCEADQDI